MHTVNSTTRSHGTNESGADSGSGDMIGLIRPHYRRRCRGRSESVQCQLGHFLAVTPFIEFLCTHATQDDQANGSKCDEFHRVPQAEEEKEYKTKRKQIQDKLIKFATRIPAFMYLTDYRENTLQDVIRKLEPELFKSVTGLSIEDFDLLVSLGVFNASHMNQAVFAFRRYEDSSLSYTGINSHPGLRHIGGYNTVNAVEA